MRLLHFLSGDKAKLGIKTEEGIIDVENTVIKNKSNLSTDLNEIIKNSNNDISYLNEYLKLNPGDRSNERFKSYGILTMFL